MMPDKSERPIPHLWVNWHAALEGRHQRGGAEFALYTDVHLTSEVRDGLGPYQLLNTVAIHSDEGVPDRMEHVARDPRPILLRVADHLADPSDPLTGTWLQNSRIDDEVAALLSLALGRRFQRGGLTRRFRPGGDPMGDPYEYGHTRPYLPQPIGVYHPMLPGIRKQVALDQARDLFAILPLLQAHTAASLVGAASAYRDAIWASDGQPDLSWLRLVSAVEAAAGRGRLTAGQEKAALEEALPTLAKALLEASPGLLALAAHELVNLTKSTKRFADFLEKYMPAFPVEGTAGVDLDWNSMRPRLTKVYGIRSKVLHDNQPIPDVMLRAPGSMQPPLWKILFESRHSVDGVEYRPGDIPMLLDTFAYIVRGALLNWWGSMARPASESRATEVSQPRPSQA
jgi:hypothetical protein